MRRRILLIVSSLLMAAGCNLNFNASISVQSGNPTFTPPSADALTPAETPDLAAIGTALALAPTLDFQASVIQNPGVQSPLQTQEPLPPSSAVVVTVAPPLSAVVVTVAPTQSSVCSPRTDLKSYRVVYWDTLSYIALRFGTTVNNLVAANCIANPDLIYPGQILYLPAYGSVAIDPPGQSTTRPPLSTNGTYQLMVTPNQGIGTEGALVLKSGSSVKLQWAQNTAEIPVSVSFYYTPTVDGLDPTLIGTSTPDAGWALTWVVPPDIHARLSAVAFLDDGSPRQPPESLLVSSQP